MTGAIIGDCIGSVYEWQPTKSIDFELFTNSTTFTDDTVLTVAIADSIVNKIDYGLNLHKWANKYPRAGYGGNFYRWLKSKNPQPYGSWGNGSAMRVSPVGFAFNNEKEVLQEAAKTAEVTHNHPEGIKGAQATALAIFLAREGKTKIEIKSQIQHKFGYHLERTLKEIRPSYSFDVSCQGTVPEAIIAFLESENFIGAIRNAISLGGDSDTLAAICGGIAQAFYKDIPDETTRKVSELLNSDLRNVAKQFCERYKIESAFD